MVGNGLLYNYFFFTRVIWWSFLMIIYAGVSWSFFIQVFYTRALAVAHFLMIWWPVFIYLFIFLRKVFLYSSLLYTCFSCVRVLIFESCGSFLMVLVVESYSTSTLWQNHCEISSKIYKLRLIIAPNLELISFWSFVQFLNAF